MWQKLSLRARLNLLLALVLTLGLAINITRLVLEAGPRVQAEDQSVIRLAREFMETLVVGLNETRDPDARLDQIIRDLNRLRHVSITRQEDAAAKPAAADDAGSDDEPSSVPAWFVALVHPEKTAVNVPISIHGRTGYLVITSHPDDEMNEIWDGIVTQLLVGSAIAVTLFLITMLVVSRALAPLQSLSQAMTDIEAGGYDTRVKARRFAGTGRDLRQAEPSGGDAGRGGRGKAPARRARRLAAGCRAQGDCPRVAR